MLPHTLITASAGSGKTWRLTVRYLRLVMMGAPPESIVALTFSRKAAGEFFNAILHRLAEAAASTVKAEALARDIEMPGTTAGEFCQALARLTSRLPFLMLGTLDSFFIRLARSFPFELGLSGDFTLLDEHQLSVEKLRVYERVFAPDEKSAGAHAGFRQAFSEATYGKDEIRVRALLDDFIGSWHYQYLAAPDPEQWGNPGRIWPVDPPVPGPQVDRAATLQRIETGLTRLSLTGAHRQRWTGFLEAAASHLPGTPVAKPMDYLWSRLLPLLKDLAGGSAELKMDRTSYSLTGPLAAALTDLLRHLIAGELAAVLRQTRGIFGIMQRYDEAYHLLVRRQGRLTFHDVQLILGGGLSPEASGHTAQTTRLPTHQENRQLMDYRLDSRYDHWLLDEFQDTSRGQWRVLANLMDEAIQDSEGRKSFFAVGDQKQSIYEWRGGTPALFEELQDQYNLPGLPPSQHPLKVEPLALSQRSGPAVIHMVNELLGDSAALAEVMPPTAVAKWRWQHHESKNTQYGGTALVIEVDPRDTAASGHVLPEADAAWHRAAELITELKPLKRGLTCAVLCHRNDRALELTDFLRATTGLPVVCESDLSIAQDNPVTSALLSLLQTAAHPGDRFAWQQVLMTPLAGVMARLFKDTDPVNKTRGPAFHGPAVRLVLGQVAELGFHDTLRWWSEALIAHLQQQDADLDSFSRSRLDELCGCAREFDSSGSRDTDEFIAYAHSWTERGASHDAALQVMTVHRSKGLTFDVVIIPDLGYQFTFVNKYTTGRDTGPRGEVNWLTKLPTKEITEADAVLGKALERATGDTWCERIAGLYVMVTRAKYANYVFIPPAPKTPGKTTGPSLHATVRHMLQQPDAGAITLGGTDYPLVARFGNPEWITDHKLLKPVPPATPPALSPPPVQTDLFAALPAAADAKSVRKSVPLRFPRPSGDPGDEQPRLFQNARQAAKEAGVSLHAAFQQVTWLDTAEAALATPGLDPAAIAEATACLRTAGLQEFFARPAGPAAVWRERAFDLMLDGAPQSGVFDRVIVHQDAAGNPLRATVIDFKTGPPQGAAAGAAQAHHRQMAIYCQALSRLLALPLQQIRPVVLFTATREAVDLERNLGCIP